MSICFLPSCPVQDNSAFQRGCRHTFSSMQNDQKLFRAHQTRRCKFISVFKRNCKIKEANKQTASVLKSKRKISSSPRTFKSLLRRLHTFQDRSAFHKVMGSLNILSSISLLGYGFLVHSLENQWKLPPNAFYTPLLSTWLFSSLMNASSGVILAAKYRSHDKPARDVFIGTSVSVIFSSCVAWWFSPGFPLFLSSKSRSAALFGCQILFGLYSTATTARDANYLIVMRKDKKTKAKIQSSEVANVVWLRDFFIYLVPILCGCLYYIIFGMVLIYDRSAVIAKCHELGDFQAMIIYFSIGFALTASLASFCVTLRDREIISRAQEMAVTFCISWLPFVAAAKTILSYGPKALELLDLGL